MLLATRTCFICNKTLMPHAARDGRLCDNPQCRWSYARLPRHQICVVCGRPLAMREFAAKTCETPECRRHNFAEKLERDLAERAILFEKARQLRDQQCAEARDLRANQAETAGITQPERYTLVVIPTFAAPLTNVPERRRRKLRDHLMRLVSQATISRATRQSQPEHTPTTRTALQGVISKACTQCQGSCCRNGGDTAYLGEATIRRFIEGNPHLRPSEVLADYLNRISNKTYASSCIYHSKNGCGLTAEMRSDTCNQFFCEGLREFIQNAPDDPQLQVFLVSANEANIEKSSFVTESSNDAIVRSGNVSDGD